MPRSVVTIRPETMVHVETTVHDATILSAGTKQAGNPPLSTDEKNSASVESAQLVDRTQKGPLHCLEKKM